MATRSRYRASDMISLLRETLGDSHVVIAEVRSSVGHVEKKPRRADAVSIGCWPTRTLEWVGYEVKVSRADWLRELDAPDKAEAVAQYLDRWYVVAPESIIRPEEVPELWGVMVPDPQRSGRLRILKKAPELHSFGRIPEDLRPFIASVVRTGIQKHPDVVLAKKAVETAERESFQRGWDAAMKRAQKEHGCTLDVDSQIRDLIATTFDYHTRLSLAEHWDSVKDAVSMAVAVVGDGISPDGWMSRLNNRARNLDRLREEIARINAWAGPAPTEETSGEEDD